MATTDYISISPTPVEESCAQAGMNKPDYEPQARKECTAFINQLRRVFGPEPAGARLKITRNPHDGGRIGEVFYYLDVVCQFEIGNEKAEEYAYKLEAETPAKWDQDALKELEIRRDS